jgi:hypothetical protein
MLQGFASCPCSLANSAQSVIPSEAEQLVEIGLEFDVEILTPLEKLAGTGKQ